MSDSEIDLSMNRERFQEWIVDPKFSILDQDEDLILGDPIYLDLLEEFLRYPKPAEGKIEVLLSAVSVIVYDEKISDTPNEATITRALDILASNESLLAKYGGYRMDYVSEVVDPLLSLHNKRVLSNRLPAVESKLNDD